MTKTMTYTYEKISVENGNWYVHLLLPLNTNIRLPLENASGQTKTPVYRIVTPQHQIDVWGALFVSKEPNYRGGFGLHPLAVRYANQWDFDKFCVNNPDERLSFDWNAEVWRAWESSTSGEYSPASNNDTP